MGDASSNSQWSHATVFLPECFAIQAIKKIQTFLNLAIRSEAIMLTFSNGNDVEGRTTSKGIKSIRLYQYCDFGFIYYAFGECNITNLKIVIKLQIGSK